MTYSKSHLCSFSITNCRAFYKNFYKSIVFLCFFFSFSATSATPEQIISIQQAAEEYVLSTIEWPTGGTLEARAANIDSRVFATDCPSNLDASSSSTNPNASNITVLVECSEDNWKLYVPVRLTRSGPQVTLVGPLSRGQIISRQDVTINMVDLQRFRRQGFSNIDAVIGAKTKKNLRAGEVIESNDICVVCRNETVTIKAVKSGMTITTKGTALTDGSHGEQIRVKNTKSNRIIEGRVTGISEVTVIF
ncbi:MULTISPECIES: flagellar basal body P-ring formation chaperone FlgA [Vibrio]|uniref:Flagella basal body P-ring formation protein FlgA n=1 Tax=Vibrio coralliilyticus TaxID=190893 RepID=A0AAJ3F078_9VIBR|nr:MULTISPECIES: flagellar basal body P-ring formation chaperone FlgA [Vibrio]AIW19594.1 flagellar basal body P-ring biosynthesis protein FlgA [Vibrio coralliilyticus]ANW25055.1 flagella basal body P-ring formation protein FlgA [Vibrio coralliilyticus]EEX35345.1 flagellar basal-body P-ring formation protein FlgA [Vibrio coralliilyticus ATCC BAA-450]ERB64523.1 flagellar basal body P-ring biosynthesis protein FlgA [Vibrio coralliilyticus OCN008]MCC2523300.1 flagellar basal body P-ring formation 